MSLILTNYAALSKRSHETMGISTQQQLPVLLLTEVSEAQRIVHAACDQLTVVVDHHLGHLVCMALPCEAVIVPSICIPIM